MLPRTSKARRAAAGQVTTISAEPKHISPHDRRRSRNLAILCVFTALFGVLLGYAANNVNGATQDPRDYLFILSFGMAMLVTAVGVLIAGAVQGTLWIRVACAGVAYLVFQQMITLAARITSILNGP
jgi:hypothetical protein